MPAVASVSASAKEVEAEEDPVLRLLSRKPLGSLKWVVEESEEPPDNQQHQQQQPQQEYDRGGIARRPSTPRGPEGGLWSAATTPPRPRSPATTPPTASNGGAGSYSSHNSSRRVYYLDMDKPARLVTDAIHQRALTAGMGAGGGAAVGLGASPMRVLSGGARSVASSSSPLTGDGVVEFVGCQELGDGGAVGWWRSWPSLSLLVLVGAAAGVLFGLRSKAGVRMGLMVVAGAAAVVVRFVLWACCRQAEAEEEVFDEGQGEEGLVFVERDAGQPGRNDRRHYGSTLVGP